MAMNKIEKKRVLCEVLSRIISDTSWAFENAKDAVKSYESRKENPEYSWDDYDEQELENRRYTVECWEKAIEQLEKLL